MLPLILNETYVNRKIITQGDTLHYQGASFIIRRIERMHIGPGGMTRTGNLYFRVEHMRGELPDAFLRATLNLKSERLPEDHYIISERFVADKEAKGYIRIDQTPMSKGIDVLKQRGFVGRLGAILSVRKEKTENPIDDEEDRYATLFLNMSLDELPPATELKSVPKNPKPAMDPDDEEQRIADLIRSVDV